MEKNGRQSAGQKSRHINIRYFFIKDRIDSGEINLLYCPTGEMLGDFFSKPQQESLFRRFRDVIMGVAHHEEIRATKAPNQERVGDRDLEAEVSTYLRADNKKVTSDVASETVVTVPKQVKPQVTWAMMAQDSWPRPSEPVRTDVQAGKAKNISTHENVGRGCHRRAWHQTVYECPSVPWWRVSHTVQLREEKSRK
eukprot:scaffold2624_cov154-Cylindrotheca_fusiformis.AAC.4